VPVESCQYFTASRDRVVGAGHSMLACIAAKLTLAPANDVNRLRAGACHRHDQRRERNGSGFPFGFVEVASVSFSQRAMLNSLGVRSLPLTKH
jgi:hypothetical protein